MLKKSDLENILLEKTEIFGVNLDMSVAFYNAVICSIIVFGSVCWGEKISKFVRARLEKIVKKKKKKAGHVVEMLLDSLKTLYEKRLLKKKT